MESSILYNLPFYLPFTLQEEPALLRSRFAGDEEIPTVALRHNPPLWVRKSQRFFAHVSPEMKKFRQWLSATTHRFGSAPILLNVRKLSSKEIKKATGSFSMIIRSDSVGIVYRARFSDGLITTIIKVKHECEDKISFPTEVHLLARLHHRHLVKLVGFSEGHERFLAFEHMENGSLRDWLHDPLKTPLNWRTRIQIAIGVAAAVVYSTGTLLLWLKAHGSINLVPF
ncbi:putative receptor-like protein kinase [Platanthera guangdongensis]|uniref:Receptor-like protein kinase n=1 Tax=Platanthera guangdongensis TaxID=2320717 RepID=A0ABR2LX37_9ASPA